MRLIASVPPFIPVSRVQILRTMAHGPGNGALLNSLRDVKTSGWIAAHPRGTRRWMTSMPTVLGDRRVCNGLWAMRIHCSPT